MINIYLGTRIQASVIINHIFFLSSSPVIMLSIAHFQCSAHKRLIISPDITYSSLCGLYQHFILSLIYVRDVKHDIERLHSDMTVMCLHFHMDWCIIHPVMVL